MTAPTMGIKGTPQSPSVTAPMMGMKETPQSPSVTAPLAGEPGSEKPPLKGEVARSAGGVTCCPSLLPVSLKNREKCDARHIAG